MLAPFNTLISGKSESSRKFWTLLWGRKWNQSLWRKLDPRALLLSPDWDLHTEECVEWFFPLNYFLFEKFPFYFSSFKKKIKWSSAFLSKICLCIERHIDIGRRSPTCRFILQPLGKGQGWPRLKPEARTSILVSHISGRAQALGAFSAALPGILARSWISHSS